MSGGPWTESGHTVRPRRRGQPGCPEAESAADEPGGPRPQRGPPGSLPCAGIALPGLAIRETEGVGLGRAIPVPSEVKLNEGNPQSRPRHLPGMAGPSRAPFAGGGTSARALESGRRPDERAQPVGPSVSPGLDPPALSRQRIPGRVPGGIAREGCGAGRRRDESRRRVPAGRTVPIRGRISVDAPPGASRKGARGGPRPRLYSGHVERRGGPRAPDDGPTRGRRGPSCHIQSPEGPTCTSRPSGNRSAAHS